MKNTRKHGTSLFHLLHVKFLVPIFAIVALFLLAACGGSSSTPTATAGSSTVAVTPTTAAITPTTAGSSSCSLVTATQAGTILGGTVQTQSNSVTIGTTKATGCAYTSSQGGSAASLEVVSATDSTTAHSTFTQLQQASQGTGGSQYQTVSGLGDAAFTNGKILYVLKGKTIMIVTVTATDSTKALSEEKQFAQAALPKVS